MKKTKLPFRLISTIVILLLAMALIVVGVLNNQVQSVLSKATRICLECVGIG